MLAANGKGLGVSAGLILLQVLLKLK